MIVYILYSLVAWTGRECNNKLLVLLLISCFILHTHIWRLVDALFDCQELRKKIVTLLFLKYAANGGSHLSNAIHFIIVGEQSKLCKKHDIRKSLLYINILFQYICRLTNKQLWLVCVYHSRLDKYRMPKVQTFTWISLHDKHELHTDILIYHV